ncbi:hypothetical protein BJI67_11025 [Acidihalobacter aeolianus]|uniref:Uncharacterized protein n=2 Tax=Acidihalobacter aeolianus TaxID=2792603 RepID=A0A1D8KCA4_9GAMM|nr:hypothetical protein BJI67_11025 [Acidihalobacter aeolianus]
MQSGKWISRVVPLLALGLLAGCGGKEQGSSAHIASEAAVSARVETVAMRSLPAYADFPGSVTSADHVVVASRLMGYVQGLRVHDGQHVRAGELLLTIDPSDVRNGIAQAKANLAKAEAALADAAANQKRYKSLYEQQAVPAQQYERMHLAYQVARGNVQAARAALASARTQLHYAEVRAPFAGTVVGKQVSDGQLAAPGQPLLTLEGAAHLQVVTQVSGQAYDHLKLGQRVAVEVGGLGAAPLTLQATVERLVSSADPMTHTHTVKLALPAASQVQPGDYVRVRIIVGQHSGILVPAAAVQRRGGIDGVFVVDAHGVAHFRMVRPGESVGGDVEIMAGLVSGDRVVISAQEQLDNGDRVSAEG